VGFASVSSGGSPAIVRRSPLLRLVALQNVTFLRAARLDVPQGERAGSWRFEMPLRSFEHPLLSTGQRRMENGKEQRLAAFAFDVAETDLPLRVAFPLLMANTLQWLAGEREGLAPSVRAGDTVTLRPEQTVLGAPQRTITASPAESSATAARHSFRPLRNGWYLAREENSDRTSWLAVNTFSEQESDLQFEAATPAPPQFVSAPRVLSLAAVTTWPLWTYLALAALVLFSTEWWLFHRRRTE